MEKNRLSAIRQDNFIDVYAIETGGNLEHYWANPSTEWIYQNEIIGSSVHGKPAVIRYGNSIDIYVLTTNRSLLHFWVGENTAWEHNSGVLAEGISASPVAVRWENDIDVYCFNNDGALLHLRTSPSTNWQYEIEEIYRSSNPTSLFAMRTQCESIDLYFLESGRIVHSHVGNHNGWEYEHEQILGDTYVPDGNLAATRLANCINLFYCDESGYVCHAVCGDFTGWSYQNRGPITHSTTARNKEFSVVQCGNNIDVYFIANDNCVHHCYNGEYNNFTWNSDDVISSSDAASGIVAVRPYSKAIDVYYLGQDDRPKHLFIGEGTNNEWHTYRTGSLNSSPDGKEQTGDHSKLQNTHIDDSELPESSRGKIDYEKALKTVYDYLRENPRAEWFAVEGENYMLLYASAGISIENDIFITINMEAKVAVMKILADKGSRFAKVDVEVLKAQVAVKLGSYVGFELYVALIDGQVSVFDIRIGLGISSGKGIDKDSLQIKEVGCGFSVGRRIGISVFDNEIAFDFKRLFSDEQWEAVRSVAYSNLQAAFPQIYVLRQVGTLVSNFTKDGRSIEIGIENYTLYPFVSPADHFEYGTIDKRYPSAIQRGQMIDFSVCKKVGYYGVEGTVVYHVRELSKNFALSFFNPIKGGNSIVCRIYKSNGSENDVKGNHFIAESVKRSAEATHVVDDEDPDFRLIYIIKSGDNARAICRVISRKLILDKP